MQNVLKDGMILGPEKTASKAASLVRLQDWVVRRALRSEQKRDWPGAILFWRKALRHFSRDDAKRAQIHGRLGRLHFVLKDSRFALMHLRAALRLGEKNPKIGLQLARTYAQLGQWQLAKTHYQRVLKTVIFDEVLWREYSLTLYRLKELQNAKKA